MKALIFLLLALSANAEEPDSVWVDPTPIPVVRNVKMEKCVTDYIDKQSSTYAKIVQRNLYELIHDFDNVVERLKGNRNITTTISYDEKIKALAVMQCEAYFATQILK